jgi:hypothetical protein
MNDEIFVEVTIVFLKKTIESMEPWNDSVDDSEFCLTLANGVKTLFYVFRFTDLEKKSNTEIIEILEQCIVHFLQFMKQISEEENLFLQLNAKDASMFVYKKMLFQQKQSTNKTATNENGYPSREIYNKMMSFFSSRMLDFENTEEWWKHEFLNQFIQNVKH